MYIQQGNVELQCPIFSSKNIMQHVTAIRINSKYWSKSSWKITPVNLQHWIYPSQHDFTILSGIFVAHMNWTFIICKKFFFAKHPLFVPWKIASNCNVSPDAVIVTATVALFELLEDDLTWIVFFPLLSNIVFGCIKNVLVSGFHLHSMKQKTQNW